MKMRGWLDKFNCKYIKLLEMLYIGHLVLLKIKEIIMDDGIKNPKVFISYSWDGQSRKDKMEELVQRLAADGIDSVIDLYDLKEGDDKFHYMEKMVTDKTVSHVLVICDKKYSDKANERKAGVGTESQIISQEIYSKVSQSKFLPLIYELDENNEVCTPVFLKVVFILIFQAQKKRMPIGKDWLGGSMENQSWSSRNWGKDQHISI